VNVKDSLIPNGEKGLFAKKQFKKDDFITFYTGMLVDAHVAKKMNPKYHLIITESVGLVCLGDKEGPGLYANSIHPNSKWPKVNARYDTKKIQIVTGRSLDTIKFVIGMRIKVPLIATRQIDADTEVIVNYRSDGYWLRNENWVPESHETTSARDSRSFGRNLYTGPSQYAGFNSQTQKFVVPLKDCLFCSSMIQEGARLPDFHGEIINNAEMDKRRQEGKGGYFLKLNDVTVMDCYEERHNNTCLSSCANSAHKKYPIQNINTGIAGKNNVVLTKYYVIKKKMWRWYYTTTALIPGHEEILADYEPYVAEEDD